MNEPSVLSVFYQGKEYEFNALFERWGYTHRIAVLIDETTYTFEPDEEGGYRALAHAEPSEAANLNNPGLLGAIADKLAKLKS